MTETNLIAEIKDAVVRGDASGAVAIAKKIVAEGIDPILAYEEGLRQGITVVGDGYSTGELFLPDLALAAETMKAAGEILEEEIQRRGTAREKVGTVLIGTVAGDMHDIGKTIVSTMLNTRGFEVIDLGVDVSNQEFVDAVKKHNPLILGMSSLLTITAIHLKEVIQLLEDAGLRSAVKVMVGGGAVENDYAQAIGADGYGQDAEQAVRLAKKLIDAS